MRLLPNTTRPKHRVRRVCHEVADSALAAIRDGKLYAVEYASFDSYCQDRWGWNRDRAYKLIAAADVAGCIQMDTKPATESQARPLTKLPADEQPDAWEEVVAEAEATGEKITAKKVEQGSQAKHERNKNPEKCCKGVDLRDTGRYHCVAELAQQCSAAAKEQHMFDYKTDFGRYVRRVRESRGLSIRQLADAAQESPTMIARIENGKATPEAWQLDAIGEALAMDQPLSEYAIPAVYREAGKFEAFALSEPLVAASLLALVPGHLLLELKGDVLKAAAKEIKKSAKKIGRSAEQHDAREINNQTDLYDDSKSFAAVESVAMLLANLPETGLPSGVRSARSELRALAEIASPSADEIADMLTRACDLLLDPKNRIPDMYSPL